MGLQKIKLKECPKDQLLNLALDLEDDEVYPALEVAEEFGVNMQTIVRRAKKIGVFLYRDSENGGHKNFVCSPSNLEAQKA